MNNVHPSLLADDKGRVLYGYRPGSVEPPSRFETLATLPLLLIGVIAFGIVVSLLWAMILVCDRIRRFFA